MRSSTASRAVSIRMGMRWPDLRNSRQTSKPLRPGIITSRTTRRSEEHTSELQSRLHLVCRLLLEKKNKDDDHGRQHRPALARVAHHDAERVAKGARDHEDRQDLQKVRQRRRVIEVWSQVDFDAST